MNLKPILISLAFSMILAGCIVEESTAPTDEKDQAVLPVSSIEGTPSSSGVVEGKSSSSTLVDTIKEVDGVLGVVSNEAGLPLAGVIVSITSEELNSWDAKSSLAKVACGGANPLAKGAMVACIPDPIAFDTTDINGVFSFAVGTGAYRLEAQYYTGNQLPEQVITAVKSIDVINGKSFPTTITLTVNSIACTKELFPVCANGQTYSNTCFAKASGATEWTEGECSTVTIPSCAVVDCVEGYICVEDSVARCIPEDTTWVACPAIYAPVCANGITYGNDCEAKAKGITEFTEGECATQKPCTINENCESWEVCVIPEVNSCATDTLNGGIACTMIMPIGKCYAVPLPYEK